MNRERGAALVAVLIVSLVVAAAGIVTWSLTRAAIESSEGRLGRLEAEMAARSALRVVSQWFDAGDRTTLLAPPGATEIDRSSRVVDLDGDRRGVPWADAPAPWNVVRRSGGGTMFGPPDRRDAEHGFFGTPAGPDLLLARDAAPNPLLDDLQRLVDTSGRVRIVRVAFFRPDPRAGPLAIATVEVVAERALPGRPAARRAVRAEIVKVPWGRYDRALSVDGDATFLGDAGWARGEAYVGGDLFADATTRGDWPGGIPWLAPDRPLRDDVDGDGTPDDADGDGEEDLATWRRLVDEIEDPWFRARVAGAWPGVDDVPGDCAQPFPFGPRADPPASVDTSRDLSGLFLGCPASRPPRPVLEAWKDLSRLGVRGARRVVPDDGGGGAFRLVGTDVSLTLEEHLAAGEGLIYVSRGSGATIELTLTGFAGALVVEGSGIRLRAGAVGPLPVEAPGDPADPRGAARPPDSDDESLAVTAVDSTCGLWSVFEWQASGGAVSARTCGPERADLLGLLAADGEVTLAGPLRIVGQVRAAELIVDGSFAAAEVVAGLGDRRRIDRRPGPPGTPRFVLTDVRTRP